MTSVPGAVRWEKPQGKHDPLVLDKTFRIVPRGVALVIGCSTFPTWNTYPGLFASLVTGNPVIVKPHPSAILPLAITVRIGRQVLAEVLNHRLAVPVAIAILVAAISLVLPSSFYFRIATLVWISAFAVIGLNLLMGYAGQVSLGHAGFFGIGAYFVAIPPSQMGIPGIFAVVFGAVFSGALAFLVGRPILKLKGHYLAVATLGFGILVAMVINNEAWITGGPDGINVPSLGLKGLLKSTFGWKIKS